MNELHDLVERVATYGGGPPMTFHVPENASIRLSDGEGHLLTGATITMWPEPDDEGNAA